MSNFAGIGAMPPGGPPAGMRPPDLSQMLENLPASKLTDLAPGQTIVVSSTKGATPGEVTAITILANADALIRMATVQQGGGRGSPNSGQAPAGPGMPTGLSGVEGLQLPGMIP
ncbi:MAG: hypothetical protein JO022_15110 [Acidobacteriaceae bacterium]|nr:hypothetical protein [Acidobacteriaceae bacterium]